ncbi:hypothetical protein AAHN97_22770 [Chitinophaga niabensis]|uniref:DUF6932 family protein n=1 Tax=Chitinophaga niabensis TaxID=536979 RepID=UPI0031BADC6F
MDIPAFTAEGKLPEGLHICTTEAFITRFCIGETREKYITRIHEIFSYAKRAEAAALFIGGSFITDNQNPDDLDCIIVFREDKYIPRNTEKLLIKGLKFDILFASLEAPEVIDSYIKLFSNSKRGGQNVGVIQVDLYSQNEVWEPRYVPDAKEFEIIQRSYNDRSVVDLKEKKGILVTIHGLLSRAEWNSDVVLIASSQDWIVAPYFYDTNSPGLLILPEKRAETLERFRMWIYDLKQRHQEEISVIAYPYGTFLLGSYLKGFTTEEEGTPVTFNSIILTGSILNENFDWEKYRGLSVGSVYNTMASKDEWVKLMPPSNLKKYLGMSNDFGQSGINGFTKYTPILTQRNYEILNHTN